MKPLKDLSSDELELLANILEISEERRAAGIITAILSEDGPTFADAMDAFDLLERLKVPPKPSTIEPQMVSRISFDGDTELQIADGDETTYYGGRVLVETLHGDTGTTVTMDPINMDGETDRATNPAIAIEERLSRWSRRFRLMMLIENTVGWDPPGEAQTDVIDHPEDIVSEACGCLYGDIVCIDEMSDGTFRKVVQPRQEPSCTRAAPCETRSQLDMEVEYFDDIGACRITLERDPSGPTTTWWMRTEARKLVVVITHCPWCGRVLA